MQAALWSLIRKIEGALFGVQHHGTVSTVSLPCFLSFSLFSPSLCNLFFFFLTVFIFLSLFFSFYLFIGLFVYFFYLLSLFYHCQSSLNQPRRTPTLHSPTNHPPPPPQTLNGNALFLPSSLSAKSLSFLPLLPPATTTRSSRSTISLDSFDSTISSSFLYRHRRCSRHVLSPLTG